MGQNGFKAATVGDFMLAVAAWQWSGRGAPTKKGGLRGDWRLKVIDALLAADLAETASQAEALVSDALKPVVNDSDLPDSMQGKQAPSWWDPAHDPFEDQQALPPGTGVSVLTRESVGRCCGFGACTCRD